MPKCRRTVAEFTDALTLDHRSNPEPTDWDRLLWTTGLWHRPSATPAADFKDADLVQWSVLYEVRPAALENKSGVPEEIAELMKAHAKPFERSGKKRDEERNQFRNHSARFSRLRSRVSSETSSQFQHRQRRGDGHLA